MTKLVLTKGADGKLCGLDEKGEKAYAKFKTALANMRPGDTLAFAFRLPRSISHHRLFFGKLQRLLSRSETFTDLDKLRAWVMMGAGYADFVPGLDGQPCAIPRSMDFDSMDEAEFSALHSDVDAFLWGQARTGHFVAFFDARKALGMHGIFYGGVWTMNRYAILAISYALGAVVAFGHAANNPNIKGNSLHQENAMFQRHSQILASTVFWPFYASNVAFSKKTTD